jgi:hypothetical protein
MNIFGFVVFPPATFIAGRNPQQSPALNARVVNGFTPVSSMELDR